MRSSAGNVEYIREAFAEAGVTILGGEGTNLSNGCGMLTVTHRPHTAPIGPASAKLRSMVSSVG